MKLTRNTNRTGAIASAIAEPADAEPMPAVEPASVVVEPTPAERAAQVEAELAAARDTLATAEADLAQAQTDYEDAVDRASVGDANAARTRINEATTLVDIARRLVVRLEAALGPLLEGAKNAAEALERDRLRATAEKAIQDYETAFRERMPAVIESLRGLLRMWAEAELAREAAAKLGAVLPHADAFRDVPVTPAVVLSRRERDLWINTFNGEPYGPGFQENVKLQSDGSGSLAAGTYTNRITQRRRYEERTVRSAIPGRSAPTLAEVLVLPGMMANDPIGWAKPDDHRGFSPRRVLDHLAALDDLIAPPAEPRIELHPLEPARDVARSQQNPLGRLLYGNA